MSFSELSPGDAFQIIPLNFSTMIGEFFFCLCLSQLSFSHHPSGKLMLHF